MPDDDSTVPWLLAPSLLPEDTPNDTLAWEDDSVPLLLTLEALLEVSPPLDDPPLDDPPLEPPTLEPMAPDAGPPVEPPVVSPVPPVGQPNAVTSKEAMNTAVIGWSFMRRNLPHA